MDVDLSKILVFDPKTRILYGSNELMFSMNGDNLQITLPGNLTPVSDLPDTPADKPKRRKSAYSRKYKKAFDQVSADFKKKNGEWKKNGFKAAVKAAHAKAKRMK